MRYRFLRFPEGKFKAVTFSYDDGLRADIRLAETVSRYGIKCTFNVCSGLMSEKDGKNFLSANEIREKIIPLGHEIAIHGHSHRAPGLSRSIDVVEEFYSCRKNLEAHFGGIIRGMAYPDTGIRVLSNGVTQQTIFDIVRSLDIVYARNTENDRSYALPDNWLDWKPTAHHTDEDVMKCVKEFLAFDETKLYCSRRGPKLFYLWGHSTEFTRNNNWELLDEICTALTSKENIWYATNMEIYEYVTAYNSLIFSSDNLTVYNPTLLTVWFDVDGKLYSVKSGETLLLK